MEMSPERLQTIVGRRIECGNIGMCDVRVWGVDDFRLNAIGKRPRYFCCAGAYPPS